jgi:hypothetical protein
MGAFQTAIDTVRNVSNGVDTVISTNNTKPEEKKSDNTKAVSSLLADTEQFEQFDAIEYLLSSL